MSKSVPLSKNLLALAVTSTLAACGGGGYGGGNNNQQPPPVQIAEAQFSNEQIEGLGFRTNGGVEGKTDANSKFRFAVGQPIEFFLGEGANRLVVGTASVAAVNGGVAPFSLQNLQQVQNDQDQYLGNLVALLIALDDDGNPTNGVRIDAATNTAVATAVAGKTVNFNQAANDFAADAVIRPLLQQLGRQLPPAGIALAEFTRAFAQSRSSSIALTSDDTRAVVVNRQAASVSVIRVRTAAGADAEELLAEVKVGKEPRYVAISPDDKRAYVTNAIDGTLSVIDLTLAKPAAIGTPIDVGVEPRGIAITPNGTYAFIANHTVGEVTLVRLADLQVIGKIRTGGNPQAIAITNDGDGNDKDERVYVTRMFSEVIDPLRPDGFDDAKQGVIDTFKVGDAVAGNAQVAQLHLAPMASGFTGDRRPYCPLTRAALAAGIPGPNPGDPVEKTIFFNSGKDATTGAGQLANTTFCPGDPATTADASKNGLIAGNPQKVYPNMLYSALVRGSSLYVPNIGASPEPPVRFNVNVQGLVGVVDRVQGQENTALSLNLNAQIVKEKQPEGADLTALLDRLFLNDLVAVDADKHGGEFLFVSRGGNYVLRATTGADGKLNILDGGTPPKAVRLQTGNMPTGVVMSHDGKRAYTNNEISTSVTALDLTNNTVLKTDINSSTPPEPGTPEHRKLLGKLAFFTALGIPDVLDTDHNGIFDVPLRDIVPLKHRNKASNNGWSSCGSCHDDGHSDNVTWIFETGPRQTIPLEGMFAHVDNFADRLKDQRVLNWSAVRASNTDFNANAIGIQGGNGFATDVNGVNRTALVFNHGPVEGVSDSLDAMHEWVATVRAPIVPKPAADVEAAGRVVFDENCASCHGGAKWTKSRTAPLYELQPAENSGLPATFVRNPLGPDFFTVGGFKPFDASLAVNGPQLLSVTRGGNVLTILDKVGTFDDLTPGPIEIRGAATVAGQSTEGFGAFGKAGFNSPSLLGLSMSAPYFHDGSALTLEAVMERHLLPKTGHVIKESVSEQQLADLLSFVRSIDDKTSKKANSDTDVFLGLQ